MTVFFSKKNNIKNSLSFLMTHFLHCFKQFKNLLKTVFLEEARSFAGLFFSVRSYRQVCRRGGGYSPPSELSSLRHVVPGGKKKP